MFLAFPPLTAGEKGAACRSTAWAASAAGAGLESPQHWALELQVVLAKAEPRFRPVLLGELAASAALEDAAAAAARPLVGSEQGAVLVAADLEVSAAEDCQVHWRSHLAAPDGTVVGLSSAAVLESGSDLAGFAAVTAE